MPGIFFEQLIDELLFCLKKSMYMNAGVLDTRIFAHGNTHVIKKYVVLLPSFPGSLSSYLNNIVFN